MASAAASKAGPRLAEVAGRVRRSEPRFGFLVFEGMFPSRFLGLPQRPDHGVQRGIQNDWRTARRIEHQARAFMAGSFEQLSAVELDGVIGILQQISG